MPLELVKQVDKELEAMVLTARGGPTGHERTPEEQETLYWQADYRIHRLSLCPTFLALHIRFVELAGNASTATSTFWVGFFLNLSILPLAIKQIPFIQNSPSIWTMVSIAAFNNTFQSPISNMALLIWIDTLCTPVFHHLLDDISDREQLHYTVIGVLLAFAYESTLFFLRATSDSIGKTLLTAIGTFVTVQLVVALLIYNYMQHATPGLFGQSNSSSPSWVSVFTLGSKYTLYQANNLAKRVFTPFLRPKEPRRPATLGPPETNLSTASPYSPLPEGYIRLLRIHKRQPSETQINCRFIIVPLTSAPPYEAISYVWGDPSRTHLISVNTTQQAITKSAYEILQRRSSFLRERIIWLDQICINQADMAEKSKQVQMMRDIYTAAGRVTAWLGDDSSAVNAGLVQRFFADLEILNGSTDIRKRISVIRGEKGRDHLSAVAEFFRNPWFRRVWIIQEAACAKKIYVIYGNVCIDWECVCRAVAVLLRRELLTIFPRTDADGKSLSYADNMHRRLGLRNADTMMAFRGDINYGKEFSLSWLLDETLGFEATDPRDMIYALLGLTTDDSKSAIIPGYEEGNAPAEVYTQAMRCLLEKAGSSPPVALHRAGIGFPRSGTVQGLPSWVPDWSCATQVRFLHDNYAAGTRSAFDARVGDDDDSSVISLHGEIVDQVEHLGPIFSAEDGETRLDETRQLQATYDKTYTMASTHALGKAQYRNESSFNEAFIRTILGNKSVGGSDGRAFSSGLSTSQCHLYFEGMKNYGAAVLAPSEIAFFFDSGPEKASPRSGAYFYNIETEQRKFLEFHARMDEFQSLLGSSIGGRRFCVTKHGRMAVVPPLCEEGDLISVFGGMSMPFLLRQTNVRDTQSSGGQRYALVGCCYVDSAMEGQIEICKGSTVTLM